MKFGRMSSQVGGLLLWLTIGWVCPMGWALEFHENVMVPMGDGVQLATNLYFPEGRSSHPVILYRTPYGKPGKDFPDAQRYTQSGYAVVVQDCRGKGSSEGDWEPFAYDAGDGLETQRWIGEQAWCNGRIGTAGGSYGGWTQWASMPGSTSHLKCAVPIVPFADVYEDIAYYDGAFQLSLLFGWGTAVGGVILGEDPMRKAFQHLPLISFGDQFDLRIPYLRHWIEHSTRDEYWEQRSIRHRFQDVTIPVLNIGGWYDIFSAPTLNLTQKVRNQSSSRLARRNQFVIIGPWAHGVGARKVGDLDFGPQATRNLAQIQQDWFDFWLHDKETGIQNWPPIEIFVMGENVWRPENEWPLKRAVTTRFYLHSNGNANTGNGHGTLSTAAPDGEELADQYVYDPSNPVPTSGGNNLVGAPIGPRDQRTVELRPDVLCYTSESLTAPMEVTGPISVTLFATSTAMDTDFTAKLVDVYPDGTAINLCDGIIRTSSSPGIDLKSGRPQEIHIDLWVTSNLFRAGHQIRVEISSSNFPRFDRQLHSTSPFGSGDQWISATQKIFHSNTHPSHISLPVIPR